MKKLLCIILLMTACFVNVSCGGDDKEETSTPSTSIVGTWRHNFSSGYILMYFSSNNTGYHQEYDEDDGKLRRKHNFNYNYDESQKHLVLKEEDGDIEEYLVMYVNSKEMELVDPDGYSSTYVRVD